MGTTRDTKMVLTNKSGFRTADFFSPFRATTTVQSIAGSDQLSFIWTRLFVPIKEAHVVNSGKK